MPTKNTFTSSVLSGLVSGLAASVVLALAGVTFRDQIEQYVAEANPTCDLPEGLVEVPLDRATVSGSAHRDAFAAEKAVDGYLGSMWIPPLKSRSETADRPLQAVFVDGEDQRTLTIELADDEDVALVCANNGVAFDPVAYEMWGRARTVEVWGDAGRRTTTTLRSLPVAEMQRNQEVADDIGTTSTVHVRLDDSYVGTRVQTFDPASCGQVDDGGPSVYAKVGNGETAKLRFARGCIRAPFRQAGLSEVTIYAKS